MPWLLENGKQYSLEQIKSGQIENSHAISFCNQWLNGHDGFRLQTSGSTGAPKRIEVTRNQLIASSNITAKFLDLRPGETALVCVNTEFIAGLMMLVRALEVGMNIIVTKAEANPLQSVSLNTPIDFVALVPYQVEAILNSPNRNDLSKIRNVIIGGAPLTNQIKSELREFTNSIYATYGMTETLTHIALQKLSGGKPDESFHVLPGFEISVDERDCLVVKANHIGSEPIVTNDIVEIKSKNQFQWSGRIDGVINSGGVKIIPEKIESVVSTVFEKFGLDNRYFIAGLPHSQLGESVTLFIEGEIRPEVLNTVSQELSTILSRYESPKSFQLLTKFAYTESGKINRPETVALLKK